MTKTNNILVRYEANEKEIIKDKAKTLSMSTNEFIRAVSLNACKDRVEYEDLSIKLLAYSYKLLEETLKEKYGGDKIREIKNKCDKKIEGWGYNKNIK